MKIFVRILTIVLLLSLFALPPLLQNNVEKRYCQNIVINIRDSADYCMVRSEEVLQLLNTPHDSVLHNTIGDISLSEIEKKINNVYGVRGAEAYIDINGTLNVVIDQRCPIMRVEPNSGGVFYVDSDGVLFEKKDSTSFLLYYVGGDIAIDELLSNGVSLLDTAIINNPLTDIFNFVNMIKQDTYWAEMVDQIYVDEKGKISFVPRVGTHTVQIGDFSNIETKLGNLEMYYDQIMPQVGWDKYSEIDLRFDGQVICR